MLGSISSFGFSYFQNQSFFSIQNSKCLIPVPQDTLVTVFISPECPICQKYSRRFNEIHNQYSEEHFRFVGIVSGIYYTEREIKGYKLRYGVKYEVILDKDYAHQKKWEATTTPEVILSVGDSVLYRGMIDNWFYAIGRSSNKTTSYFLLDAIKALRAGNPIEVKETKPIGCFIE
jgi:hypothetical protein